MLSVSIVGGDCRGERSFVSMMDGDWGSGDCSGEALSVPVVDDDWGSGGEAFASASTADKKLLTGRSTG